MEERIKLERIDIAPKQYTSGDAQDWTYEYTWEDYDTACNCEQEIEYAYEFGLPNLNAQFLASKIRYYFIDHPEKLLKKEGV